MNALLYNGVIKSQFNSNLQSSTLKRLIYHSYHLFSTTSHDEERELSDFLSYLHSLTNYEKSGVPKDAGTDSDDGLDLGRMRRLMSHLSNPHHNFKAVHIAGTKGKGSTATFLSSILRAEGYSVGCYSSPHIRTLRERMTLGKCGHPVSAEVLNSLFRRIKAKLDEAIESENGCLTHFEILTATAFALFADENVDIAIVEAGLGGARDATNIIRNSELAASVITTIGEEHLAALGGSLESIALAKSGIIKRGRPVVLGGHFHPNIEFMLCDKASVMSSPVVCASEAASKSSINSIRIVDCRPCQSSDIIVQVNRQSLELNDVKLRMVGRHQLQNAATAACTALCLRDQGWVISDTSIVTGLERAYLLGRSQFLSPKEAEALGLPGATVLLDGAHTKDSATALMETIQMVCPEAHLALVVAMASDKDHLAFSRECLSRTQPEAVFLTEVNVAGGKSRTTPASLLMDRWTQASEELGIKPVRDSKNQSGCSTRELRSRVLLFAESSLIDCLRSANEILKRRVGDTEKQSSVIVVTGSLHIVSSVLASLGR